MGRVVHRQLHALDAAQGAAGTAISLDDDRPPCLSSISTLHAWPCPAQQAAADLVPQDKVAMVRSYIDRPLLGMSLLALVPFVSAVCYRLLDPVLINTAPRKERRAWVRAQPPHRGTTLVMPWLSPACVCLVGDQSIIFVLGLRSAGACPSLPLHHTQASPCVSSTPSSVSRRYSPQPDGERGGHQGPLRSLGAVRLHRATGTAGPLLQVGSTTLKHQLPTSPAPA